MQVVSSASPNNTIVIATTPGAAVMPWAQKVKGILVVFMPGQEFGNALAVGKGGWMDGSMTD